MTGAAARRMVYEMTDIVSYLRDFWHDEGGISSVEYALLLAFLGAAIIAAGEDLSTAVSDEISAMADCIEKAKKGC